MKYVKYILLCFAIFLLLGSISVAPVNANVNDWQLQITDYKIEKELHTVKYDVAYDGTITPIYYDNIAPEGMQYVLVNLNALKTNNVLNELDTKELILHVDSNEYERIDDGFISNHDYTRLNTKLSVSKTGYVVFTIPNTIYSLDNEIWYISCGSYRSEDYQHSNELQFGKTIMEQQEEIEQNIENAFATGHYTMENPLVYQDVYGNTPLTALILFETEEDASISVTIKGKDVFTDVIYDIDGNTKIHRIPIIGLYADYNNEVILSDGSKEKSIYIQTDELPDEITSVVKKVDNTSAKSIGNDLYFLQDPYHIIFDKNGEIRWYLTEKFKFDDCSAAFAVNYKDNSIWLTMNELYKNVNSNQGEILNMSLIGKINLIFTMQNVIGHHDGDVLPNGNYLVLANYQTIFEIDHKTGNVVSIFNFANYYDWVKENYSYEDGNAELDWNHINNVEYIAENNSILLSLRNQHLILNIDWTTKEILWALTPAYREINGEVHAYQDILTDKLILPSEDDSEFEWFYSQHDPSFVSYDENLNIFEFVLFDNSTYRYAVGQTPNDLEYSRVVHYKVDIDNRTVQQLFEYGKQRGKELYSPYYGSAEFNELGEYYLGNYRGFNDVVGKNSRIVKVATNGDLLSEYEIQNTKSGSYRVSSFPLNSMNNITFETKGVVKHYYPSTSWTQASLAEDYETMNKLSLSEFYRNNDSITITGTIQCDNVTYPARTELLAVSSKDTYSFEISMAKYTEGVFYGKDIPLDNLPADKYDLYLRAVGNNGSVYLNNLNKYIDLSLSKDIEINDIIEEQRVLTDNYLAMLDNSYTLANPIIVVNPYEISPLTALVMFNTEDNAKISVTVHSKEGNADLVNEYEEYTKSHVIPVYGLYANDSTQVTIKAITPTGETQTKVLSIVGDSLPNKVMNLEPTISSSTWDNKLLFISPGSSGRTATAIDSNGDIRWVFSLENVAVVGPYVKLDNGHFIVASDKMYGNYYHQSFYEIDLLGRVYKEYLVNGHHHDITVNKDGNYLVLANNVFEGTVEDFMYEIDRETGEVLRTWDFGALLGMEQTSDSLYNSGTHDWLHNNGLAYNQEENSVILSCRHQDMIFKLMLDTGEIKWILSDPNDEWSDIHKDKLLTPTSELFEYTYGQHNAIILPDNRIMTFDNGDYRGKTVETLVPAEQGYSRVAIFSIDEENMTVALDWEFGKEYGSDILAAYVGGVQYLEENHYILHFGGIIKNALGNPTYEILDGIMGGSSRTEIYEIKDDQIINNFSVSSSPSVSGNTYRSQLISPYEISKEYVLENTALRLGELIREGVFSVASETEINDSIELDNVSIKSDGLQLIISINDNKLSDGSYKLYAKGLNSHYQLATEISGNTYSLTFNHSELDTDSYRFYLINSQTKEIFDLGYEWINENEERNIDKYNILAVANDELLGTVMGSGIYFENTPLTLTSKAREGKKFNGWYVNGNVVCESTTFSFIPTQDIVVEARFTDDIMSDLIGVTTNVNSITLDANNKTAIITVIKEPATAKDNPLFESSDTNVVAVNPQGEITAIKNGTATISIKNKDGKVLATVSVTVHLSTESSVGSSGGPSSNKLNTNMIYGTVPTKEIIKEFESNKSVVVKLSKSQIISKDIITSMVGKDVSLTAKVMSGTNELYSFIFDGKIINEVKDVNIGLTFISTQQDIIDSLFKENKTKTLYFEHSGTLPGITKIKVNVSDTYEDGTSVNVYHFDEETHAIMLVGSNVVVDGSVTFEINHCSTYVISENKGVLTDELTEADLVAYSRMDMDVYANSRVTSIEKSGDGFMVEGYMFEANADCIYNDARNWREIVFVNVNDASTEYAYRKQVDNIYNPWLNSNMTATVNGKYRLDYANYLIEVNPLDVNKYAGNVPGHTMAKGTYYVYMRISNGKTSYLFPLVDRTLSDGTNMENTNMLPEGFSIKDQTSRSLVYTVK